MKNSYMEDFSHSKFEPSVQNLQVIERYGD